MVTPNYWRRVLSCPAELQCGQVRSKDCEMTSRAITGLPASHLDDMSTYYLHVCAYLPISRNSLYEETVDSRLATASKKSKLPPSMRLFVQLKISAPHGYDEFSRCSSNGPSVLATPVSPPKAGDRHRGFIVEGVCRPEFCLSGGP